MFTSFGKSLVLIFSSFLIAWFTTGYGYSIVRVTPHYTNPDYLIAMFLDWLWYLLMLNLVWIGVVKVLKK
jgi:hypothetical protein